MTVAAAGVASQPASIVSFILVLGPDFPFTSRSKSSSVAPFVESNVIPLTPPNPMKSSVGVTALPPFTTESSCNFFICSSSTFLESDLIKSMKDRNCLRSNKGPKLMLHRMGKMSMATKSASALSPTTRSTSSAAIITAGSLVLIALMSGMIFSCIVYLSRALDEDIFFFSGLIPSSPSSADDDSFVPPQRMTKARHPRTLMAKLLVLLKTAATIGNSSFLIVLKSKTGNMTGRPRKAASTSEGVGDSMATKTIGRTSR